MQQFLCVSDGALRPAQGIGRRILVEDRESHFRELQDFATSEMAGDQWVDADASGPQRKADDAMAIESLREDIRRLSLRGAAFAYQEAGPHSGETIIVLHGGRGIGDHRSDFKAFLPLGDDRRLIAYDMRGCGQSSLTPPYSFEGFAEDLDAIRRHFCGDGRIILIGGSFGGMIALTYAVRHPEGLSHLILRGTAPSHHHEAEAIANFEARLGRAPSASLRMVEKIFSDAVVDDIELRLIWLALQPLYFERFDPDQALELTRQMHLHAMTHNELFKEKTYDLRDRLAEIRVPTLVVVGSEDWICPPRQSRLIAEGIPGALLFEVQGANHAVHIEANHEVIGRIRRFLDGDRSP